jgi:hypothetical protein
MRSEAGSSPAGNRMARVAVHDDGAVGRWALPTSDRPRGVDGDVRVSEGRSRNLTCVPNNEMVSMKTLPSGIKKNQPIGSKPGTR